jgi:hypothetical protein
LIRLCIARPFPASLYTAFTVFGLKIVEKIEVVKSALYGRELRLWCTPFSAGESLLEILALPCFALPTAFSVGQLQKTEIVNRVVGKAVRFALAHPSFQFLESL